MAGCIGVLGAFTFVSSARCRTVDGFFGFVAETCPSVGFPHFGWAKAAYRAGDADGMAAHLARAMAVEPDHREFRKLRPLLAKTYMKTGRYAEALVELETALSVHADDDVAWGLKAACLAYLGRMDEAGAAVGRAVVLAPGTEAYRRLAGQIGWGE